MGARRIGLKNTFFLKNHNLSFENDCASLHSAFTSFLPKRPPKRDRERFLGFSGPKKSGESKAEGSGLRDARTAEPLLQEVSDSSVFFSFLIVFYSFFYSFLELSMLNV